MISMPHGSLARLQLLALLATLAAFSANVGGGEEGGYSLSLALEVVRSQ